jgi:hypothetical protein
MFISKCRPVTAVCCFQLNNDGISVLRGHTQLMQPTNFTYMYCATTHTADAAQRFHIYVLRRALALSGGRVASRQIPALGVAPRDCVDYKHGALINDMITSTHLNKNPIHIFCYYTC